MMSFYLLKAVFQLRLIPYPVFSHYPHTHAWSFHKHTLMSKCPEYQPALSACPSNWGHGPQVSETTHPIGRQWQSFLYRYENWCLLGFVLALCLLFYLLLLSNLECQQHYVLMSSLSIHLGVFHCLAKLSCGPGISYIIFCKNYPHLKHLLL